MKILITGANGFLGRALIRRLSAVQAMEILALARRPQDFTPPPSNVIVYPYELSLGPANELRGQQVDVILHLAYEFSTAKTPLAEDPNVVGAQLLFAQFPEARRIYFSSMSAHRQTLSRYGQSKWHIEQTLRPERDAVIRPGFVIGPGGICQRLIHQLETLPLHPLFYGGRREVQIVAVDDLVEAVWRILHQNLTGQFNLAHRHSYPLAEFYRELLRPSGQKLRPVALPGDPFLSLFRAFEKLGMNLPLTSENLLGLKSMVTVDVDTSARRLDMDFRSLPEAVAQLPKETTSGAQT